MRNCVTVLAVLCVIAAGSVRSASAQVKKLSANLVQVTVTGQGLDEQEAMHDAKRKAVEQGAGATIHSHSETKDFVLVKDTILARAAGFVQSVKVLSQGEDEEIFSVKIEAVVSVKGIVDAWGATTMLLKEMGRPKVMVFVTEKMDNLDKRRTEIVDDSTVQTRIENMLLKSGFLLVNKKQIKANDQAAIQAAILENKPQVVQNIAKQFGAQLFISGTANATSGVVKSIGGVRFYTYEAEANVKCYRSDTAQLISSIPGESTRGVQRVWRSAAKQALDSQAKVIAPRVQSNILTFWQDALSGRGEVILEVSGFAKASEYFKLKRELKKIKGVKAVNGKYANKMAKMSIESDTNAETLAERISEALEKLIEITDISQNVIKADCVK